MLNRHLTVYTPGTPPEEARAAWLAGEAMHSHELGDVDRKTADRLNAVSVVIYCGAGGALVSTIHWPPTERPAASGGGCAAALVLAGLFVVLYSLLLVTS